MKLPTPPKVTRHLSCHSRGGGDPVFLKSSALPPEFTPAQAEAGVTTCGASYEAVKFPVRSNWPPRRPAARLYSVYCFLSTVFPGPP